MESILARLPRGSRVAVIRLRSLGDCVLTTPALHLLKQHRPDLRLAVVVEDRFRGVYEDNPDVDEMVEAEIGAVRRSRPALCLNLHGGTRSAWMTALSGARYRAGFGHFQFGFLYHIRIPRAQVVLGEERTVHTAEHMASAMFHLGVPRAPIPRARLFAPAPGEVAEQVRTQLPAKALADARASDTHAHVPLRDRDPALADARASDTALPRRDREGALAAHGAPVAVIHPVAAAADKTWPAERFLAVAEHLRVAGMEPVVIGGPGDDLSPFAGFRTLAGAPLADVKSLLAGASLFLGNDSGPAHMAAAFGLPVVVLFGSSDPVVWAPWQTASEVLTSPSGIASIETRRVLDAIERLRVAA